MVNFPKQYTSILQATKQAGFDMASDVLTGTLLQTLAASKLNGKMLELGTGTGLSTSWILAGMSSKSSIVSVENNEAYLAIARHFLSADSRLDLQLADAERWLITNKEERFDFIFADTWHGKYFSLETTLAMLKPGGIYVIDDMLPQPNWPEGHDQKVKQLIAYLEQREDLLIVQLDWSTGIIMATKR